MSGFDSDTDASQQAALGLSGGLTSALMDLLVADSIIPGSSPSYELCKKIFVDHPLGGKMAESPVKLAQSQRREIKIPGAPESDLIKAFDKEWDQLGSIGADLIIRNLRTLSRVYGISSLAVGTRGKKQDGELDLETLHEQDLFFNVLDPLNTAGSLVLNQDPNSPEFMKPRRIQAAGVDWNPTRTLVMLNEQPIYIEWSNSAFGFVGRSVYQRALYPLKSFVQTMITNQAVQEKVGLLIMKMKSPGSVIDRRAMSWFGAKRQALKGAKTGNVLSVGVDENVESLNFTNLKDAAEYSRENILKDIATAADMPASLINQETLAEGFGEGSEDAKNIARYIDSERIAMTPAYRFIDMIVMRRAWSPEFYASMQSKYPEAYAKRSYQEVFYEWKNAFEATWPNLLAEPDSELVKVEDMTVKGAIAAYEVMVPNLDPENRAKATVWLADVMNSRKIMSSSTLDLDEEAIASYVPPVVEEEEPASGGDEIREGKDRLRVAT